MNTITSFNARNLGSFDLSDFEVTEEAKSKADYLILMTDRIIANLVQENSTRRSRMYKMRDFYDGIRDPLEYKYLEDNFGIGNSSEIKFTPLVRNRIDALIGLLSSTEFDFKATITDSDSIYKAEEEKAKAMLEKLISKFKEEAAIAKTTKEVSGKEYTTATPIDKLMLEIEEDTNSNWRNSFVEAAINFIENLKESPEVALRVIRELLFEDFAVVGEAVYRVKPREHGISPRIEALLPENCYYNLRRDQISISESLEFVYVRYLTKGEILQEYGHLMTDDEIKEMLSMDTVKLSGSMLGYHTLTEYAVIDNQDEERSKASMDRNQRFIADQDVIKVYETEWKATNPYNVNSELARNSFVVDGPTPKVIKKQRQDLYRSTRIGDRVYIDAGRVENPTRYKGNPDKTYLSFNGRKFSSRGGSPYSILWKCKDIQDMHDILLFHRDNLLSNSGVRGLTLDFPNIPEFYGADEMERVMKAVAMIKQGVNLTDSSQEGAEAANAGHGTFDMTVNGESLEAINKTLEQLDNEATKITGVSNAMLGAIEQREAVSNVKTGIAQSSLVLKNLYDHHDFVMSHLLVDSINATKNTIDEPFTGSHSNGTKIFTILPKHFSFTDFRIQVINSSAEKLKLDAAKNMVMTGVQSGAVPYPVGVDIIFSDSPHKIIETVREESKKQGDMQKKLEEATNQLKQLDAELKKAQGELAAIDQNKIKLDQERLLLDKENSAQKNKYNSDLLAQKKEYDDEILGLKREELEVEREQIYALGAGSEKGEVRNDIV